jgi:eukaryotic-like serine/threonine-protein kinase
MPIPAGTRLGSYDVLSPLGAGGMGEVYRARDARLDRDVAIKVLPPLLADDPTALARFEREAKSVAHLSHPNIMGIFDFGHEPSRPGGRAGVTYAVMELLEGETLRERLARGPLSPRKALDYAVQIAHGLAAAHGKGIVHRDLKPDNLFLTHDDRAKILDFGLARPIDLGETAVTGAGVATAAGLVMGTLGYMAPEQVRGLAVDHRTDIFAFGAVLYEMLSGRRAFGGESAADTISAVLNSEPPEIDAPGATLPPALDRIVRRCLEKKPDLRFQSAQDLAFALGTLSARDSGVMSAAADPVAALPRRRAAVRLPWAIAVLAVAGAAATVLTRGNGPVAEPPWQYFTAVTDAAGVETWPALSPDGSSVAYATRASGNWDIYVQRVGGRSPVGLAIDPDRQESSPAFSPDGRFVAYHDGRGRGAIFVASATGESPRRITDFGVHPAWSPDSRQIVFTKEEIESPYSRTGDSTLWVVDAAGGTPRQIEGAGDAAQASWSPSGRRLVYWSNPRGRRDIYTIAVDGGERVPVTDDAPLDWAPTWAPDGRHIYFASDRGGSMNIWRIPVDESSGRPLGQPEPITTGVQAAADLPGFSADGSRLVFRSMVSAVNLVAIPFDPATLRAGTPRVLNNSNASRGPSDVSPDGRWLSLHNLGEPQEDVFISASDGTGVRRLTDDAARDRLPVWGPDGKTLYFYSNRDVDYGIWAIGADGGGLRKVVAVPGGVLYPIVSPTGDRLVTSASSGRAELYLSRLAPGTPPEGNAEALPGQSPESPFFATSWSPDGSRLGGYFTTDGGTPQGIGVYDLATRRFTIRVESPTQFVRWLPDNRHLVYFSADGQSLLAFDSVTGRVQRIEVALPLRSSGEGLALAPDGRTIFYGGRRQEADIWVVQRVQRDR